MAAGRGPYESGVYGGTFTALPGDFAERFTAVADEFRKCGLVTRVRCSTRPDAADSGRLTALRGLGLDMVEIGVQTFEAGVLAASGRGHGPGEIFSACRAVREAGLSLGVQLLPGLPGHTPEMFARDVELAATLVPETARIYPCLVAAGTRLAAMSRPGNTRPGTRIRPWRRWPEDFRSCGGPGCGSSVSGLRPRTACRRPSWPGRRIRPWETGPGPGRFMPWSGTRPWDSGRDPNGCWPPRGMPGSSGGTAGSLRPAMPAWACPGSRCVSTGWRPSRCGPMRSRHEAEGTRDPAGP
jgi:hypothetical protein